MIKNTIIIFLYGAGEATIKRELAEFIGVPVSKNKAVSGAYVYILGCINDKLAVELKLLFILKFICCRHSGSDVFNFPGVTCSQFYNEQKTKQLSILTEVGAFRPRVNVKLFTKCKEHTYRRAGANLLHGFDARVCHYVIKCFKDKNLPIYTIHDSFTVLPEHVPFLLNCYQQGLINLKNTPLSVIYSGFKGNLFIQNLEFARRNLRDDAIFDSCCLKPLVYYI
jgi:hypothetical protein